MLKIQKTTSIVYRAGATIIFMVSIFLFNFSFVDVHAETFVQEDLLITTSTQLLSKSIFRENEKASIIIDPHFTDYTTSLILYVSNGDTPETWTYLPETLGFGEFLFSDYFSFGSPTGKYLLVEYVNDGQTFSCYGMPSDDCIANPHFISKSHFEIRDDVVVVPEVVQENATTTSITSDLSDGLTGTALIDGVLVSGTTTTEVAGTSSPVTPSLLEMMASVINALIPPPEDTPVSETPNNISEETPATSSVTGDTNTNGTTTTTF